MINSREFDSIMIYVRDMVDVFSLIGDALSKSINELLVGTGFQLPSWLGGDMTPILLMVGYGVPVYLTYALVKWLFNL